MHKRTLLVALLLVFLMPVAGYGAHATPQQIRQLATKLDPWLACINGNAKSFAIEIEIDAKVKGQAMAGTVRLVRFNDDAWRLVMTHPSFSLSLDRTAERTRLVLPAHKTAILGEGELAAGETLDPVGLFIRLLSMDSMASTVFLMAGSCDGQMAAISLTSLAELEPADEKALRWIIPKIDNASLEFSPDGRTLKIMFPSGSAILRRIAVSQVSPQQDMPEGFDVRQVNRTEMERLFVRGVRRSTEVLWPGPSLIHPSQNSRFVEHGELQWKQGQRLVLLKGTPLQVGLAHGELLQNEIRRLCDSVLYLVGIAKTVQTGRWFLDDLRDAYKRLETYIPQAHKIEMDAMAKSSGVRAEEVRLANVFPELFHCSGFAVFGSATQEGKLYHGRVLDYMTVIGLQDSAALFVINTEGKIPFANVGFAGFTGSVSGMNAKKISLGEMGGGGEGDWDGVPMATLMRRALEECSTLDEVKALWQNSPRTCEYYYVFADGKIPDAVGVAATPEHLEFINPSQAHARLGEGIKDTVLMSGGDRLKVLRQRITESHGQIDVDKAIWLMSRPVATGSNLHNVLFVPQDLKLYVAHASRRQVAAERPYVLFDLGVLLKTSSLFLVPKKVR